MRKIMISIYFLISFSNHLSGQAKYRLKDSMYCCKIIDSNISGIVQDYIKRGFKNGNEKGIVVVKFPYLKYDKTNYEFYISEIITKSTFQVTKPTAFSTINGHLVLFYGLLDTSICIKRYDDFQANIFANHLIDDDLKKNKISKKAFFLFDPEILKIVVRNNSIILKKELSKQLDLTPP